MGANPTVIIQWFNLLKKIQSEVQIVSPTQIWSSDQTGIQNVPKEKKVLGIKNIRTFQQVSSEQGEMLTILSFVILSLFTVQQYIKSHVLLNCQLLANHWGSITNRPCMWLGIVQDSMVISQERHGFGLPLEENEGYDSDM